MMGITEYHVVCLINIEGSFISFKPIIKFMKFNAYNILQTLAIVQEKKTFVSSANNATEETVDTLLISFTYKISSNGPSIEPWGAPHFTCKRSELLPLKRVNCLPL